MVETTEAEILEAQARLEQKRKLSKVVALPSAVRDLLPGISRTEVTSGDAVRCPSHHVDLVDGVCPVCQDLTDRVNARVAAAKVEEMKRAFDAIRLGKRYQGVTFDDYHPTCDDAARVKSRCQRYAETFSDRLAGCDNLLLLGNPGTGKNMLAAAICNRVAQDGFHPLHTTAMRLVRRITETWGGHSAEKEQTVIDSFSEPDVLVVDEVGVQFGSRKEEILLFEALNGRYEEKRPTIIIANLQIEAVETFLGTRVMDRFYEGRSAVLEFTWDSYRRRRTF